MNIFKSNSFKEDEMNKKGATVFFVLAIIPYAIVNIYVAGISELNTTKIFVINAVVGWALFFLVNKFTDNLYGFKYKLSGASLFYIFIQLLVAYLPAAIIIVLLSTQSVAIAVALSFLTEWALPRIN